MPKFRAQSLADLHIAEANAGRLARKAKIVVACEASDRSWCEFDADDLEHAIRLADNAVTLLNARGCSVWAVNAGGAINAQRSLYVIFASSQDYLDHAAMEALRNA